MEKVRSKVGLPFRTAARARSLRGGALRSVASCDAILPGRARVWLVLECQGADIQHALADFDARVADGRLPMAADGHPAIPAAAETWISEFLRSHIPTEF